CRDGARNLVGTTCAARERQRRWLAALAAASPPVAILAAYQTAELHEAVVVKLGATHHVLAFYPHPAVDPGVTGKLADARSDAQLMAATRDAGARGAGASP